MEVCPTGSDTYWSPTGNYTIQTEAPPSLSLPPKHTTLRSNRNHGNQRNCGKGIRILDRSVSNRRRFSSNDVSRHRRKSNQKIIIRQPHGWYQIDQLARNQSLESRIPIYEPVTTYSIIGDETPQKKKRNKNRRHSETCGDSQSTHAPANFNSTLNLLRELPCARLHYNSFRRLFPNLPTRTMKEKKFRLDAAKELPFYKYPDEQLPGILNSIENEFRINDPSIHSIQKYSIATDNESIAWLPDPPTQMGDDSRCDSEIDHDDDTNAATLCDYTEADLSANQKAMSPKASACSEPDTLTCSSQNEPVTQLDCAKPPVSPKLPYEKGCINEESFEWLPYIDVNGEESIGLKTCEPIQEAFVINDAKEAASIESQGSINKLAVRPSPVLTQTLANNTEITLNPQLTNQTCESSPTAVKKQSFSTLICYACAEVAYPAERLETENKVFHVACFRCHQCNSMLQRGTWNQRGQHYYCNPCHRRLALQTLRH